MSTYEINSPELWLDELPTPNAQSNKYTRGFLLILGGEYMTGATCLAARSAQRIGAGLVKIACPRGAQDVYRIVNQSAIVIGFRDTADFKDNLDDRRLNTLLVGPGLGDGPANAERVQSMIKLEKPIVLDADALNLMSLDFTYFVELFQNISDSHDKILLTPHKGEFDRLFPDLAEHNPAEATQTAATRIDCTVMLKGHHTLIAHPKKPMIVNKQAPSWLATAGSGDVLSGICAGLIAQGVSPYIAAAMGNFILSEAARRLGAGLIAEDLHAIIPRIYADLIIRKVNT